MTVYKVVTISDAESVQTYCDQFAADGYELRVGTDMYLVFSKEETAQAHAIEPKKRTHSQNRGYIG